MSFVYIIIFFLIFSPAKATDSSSPLSVVEKIEKNLIFSNEIEKQENAGELVIRKGSWNQDDTEKLQDLTFENKKIVTEVKKTQDSSAAIELKRKAYDAITVGQYEIAVELYKKALRINKDDVYSTLGLATAYQHLGQYVQAKPLYLKVLEVFPADQQVMANLIAIVSDEAPYEAVYLLSSIADRNLDSPLIQAQTSIAYSRVKNYEKAIEYIRRAIDIDDSNIEYKYNLAVLYDLSQNYFQARNVYGELIRLYAIRRSDFNNLPIEDIQERANVINSLINMSNKKK
jgi:Flp pilus assembly protein TadD